jgi:alkylation response protein AidB-like acyl-CoA dehydrogenase
MCVPQAFGGGEVVAATMVEAIEEIAKADGSAAWCVMIGATSGLVSAYLPEAVARDIYAAPHHVTGGVFAPHGRATVVAGGYRVSGRWPFASGCEHCNWLMGGCVILDDGRPRLLPNGQPDARMTLFPAADVEIIDTWTVAGLRGTGSHDIAVSELFVPEGRSVSLLTDRPCQPGPLYAFPVFGLLALGIAGVALGVARRAIDELVQLAAAKTPTGSRKRLGERAMIQLHVAEAEALLRSARAFLFDAIGDAWRAARGAGTISVAQRSLLRLAATHAATSAAKVVDLMYNAGGGTSVYATSPLQRQFRDIHVVTQHMMVAPPTYELTGRLFLGIDTDTSML